MNILEREVDSFIREALLKMASVYKETYAAAPTDDSMLTSPVIARTAMSPMGLLISRFLDKEATYSLITDDELRCRMVQDLVESTAADPTEMYFVMFESAYSTAADLANRTDYLVTFSFGAGVQRMYTLRMHKGLPEGEVQCYEGTEQMRAVTEALDFEAGRGSDSKGRFH